MVQRAKARSGRHVERYTRTRAASEWGSSLVGTIAFLLLLTGYPPNG